MLSLSPRPTTGTRPPRCSHGKATVAGHLGNIAFKTRRKLEWNTARETFPSDAEACRLLAREPRKPWDLI